MPTTRSESRFPVRQATTLKLEFSASTFGRHWTPRRFTPSVTFTRIVPPTPVALPKGPPPPATEPDVTLTITERIGGDFVSDMYYATLSTGDSERLFVRVTDLLTFSKENQNTAEGGMATSHHTFTMVGDSQVVPRYDGIFACDMLYCTVFEDAGRSLTEEEKNSKEVQAEALAAVRAINAAGVAPDMWKWRYLTRGHDGKIKVADLSWNTIMGNVPRRALEMWKTSEEDIVRNHRQDSNCVEQVEELFECGERIVG